MRFTSLLVLLVVAFFSSDLSCINAEETTPNNIEDVPASDTDVINNKVRRLRGRQKVNSEERYVAVVPVAAYLNMMDDDTSTTSTQILHAVQDNKPLSKWAKTLIVLLGLGVTAGSIVGGIKLVDMLSKKE